MHSFFRAYQIPKAITEPSFNTTSNGCYQPFLPKYQEHKIKWFGCTFPTRTSRLSTITSARSGVLTFEQPRRYIYLYRPKYLPWTEFELTNKPEEAKEVYQELLEAYNQNDMKLVKDIFHHSRSIGICPSLETFRKMIVVYYREGSAYDIAWNFLLDIFSKQGLIAKSEEVFWITYLSVPGGSKDHFNYQALLRCYMMRGRYLRAFILLNGMAEIGLDPTTDQYITLRNFASERLATIPGGLDPMDFTDEQKRLYEDACEEYNNGNIRPLAELTIEYTPEQTEWLENENKKVPHPPIDSRLAYKDLLDTGAHFWRQYKSMIAKIPK